MNCKKCGTRLADEWKCCPTCGTQIGRESGEAKIADARKMPRSQKNNK